MATYRTYFRDHSAVDINGRQDFEADHDSAALVIAMVLGDACSDVSASFELWDGMRRVVAPAITSPFPTDLEQLTMRMQEHVARTEEAISNSAWSIATSQRLLERTAQLAAC